MIRIKIDEDDYADAGVPLQTAPLGSWSVAGSSRLFTVGGTMPSFGVNAPGPLRSIVFHVLGPAEWTLISINFGSCFPVTPTFHGHFAPASTAHRRLMGSFEYTVGPGGGTEFRCCRGAAIVLPLLLAGCAGVLDPAGPIAAQEKTLLFNALAIMLMIVVPVIVGTLAFAFWYRASNARATRHPDFVYSGKVELVTWGVPALAVLLLGGLAYFGAHALDPYKPIASRVRPVQVEVVSLDWKWLFIYPELGVASINELVIPAGTPVDFRLTSATVMNTFYVSRLGSMIYTMNGMATRLHLQADRPGTYHGMSAHYSGDGFADMKFAVRSVSPANFAGWAARTRAASGPVLDEPAYRGLLRQTQNVTPFTYRAVQPRLFDAIVDQSLPPGDGPDVSTPSTATPADGKS